MAPTKRLLVYRYVFVHYSPIEVCACQRVRDTADDENERGAIDTSPESRAGRGDGEVLSVLQQEGLRWEASWKKRMQWATSLFSKIENERAVTTKTMKGKEEKEDSKEKESASAKAFGLRRINHIQACSC
jgi:hypothetical protein